MRSQLRPLWSVWIKGIYVSTHAYIRLGEFLYTSRLSRIYALANACTGVGGCLYRRRRMPAQALADACTGVGRMDT